MKQFIQKNKWLFIIALCGFLAAAAAVWGRFSVESNNKTYDVVLDYAELELLAQQSHEDLSWWLGQFVDMGITKVGLAEETIDTLRKNPDVPVMADLAENIMSDINWKDDYPAAFVDKVEEAGLDPFDVIVAVEDAWYYDFIADALNNRYDHKQFILYPGNEFSRDGQGGFVWINGTVKETLYSAAQKELLTDGKGFREFTDYLSSKLMSLSLGILPEKQTIVENAGMMVIPRTTSYEGWNDAKYAKAVLGDYAKLAHVPDYMIVAGEGIIGYDDGIDTVVNYLQDSGTSIATIENTTQLQNITQDGVEETIEAVDYNVVRAFTVWDYIQYRYQYYGYEGAKEIENTLFRAISERNIRVIYFKPFKEFEDSKVYITNIEEYKELFANLADRLEPHGLKLGRASVMSPYKTGMIQKDVMALGSVAAAVLLLCGFLPIGRRGRIALMVAGSLCAVAAFFVAPNMAKLLLSFASAVVFPCLATLLLVGKAREDSRRLGPNAKISQIILCAASALIVGVLVSLAGGVMTAAPISEINFMLEIDVFRGVKLAQLLPLAFFPIAFLAYFGFGDQKKKDGQLEFHDLVEMLNVKIKVWMIIVGVICAGVGAYYIIRTGHTSNLTPSTVEMLFRNTLEDTLIARPRNKEFLFAFPSAMLFVYCAVRRMKLPSALFGLCSVIGLTSVVNTFMHIRTPLYLGFARTGLSLLFSLILGGVAIIILELLRRLYKKTIQLLDTSATTK